MLHTDCLSPSCSQVNERAAQMAGVPDVRGDALVVSEYAEHSTASELCGSETCQISGNGHSCGPHDVTVRSPTGNVSFRIDTFRHGACLQEIRSKEKKIHDTNSNCGAPTLGMLLVLRPCLVLLWKVAF